MDLKSQRITLALSATALAAYALYCYSQKKHLKQSITATAQIDKSSGISVYYKNHSNKSLVLFIHGLGGNMSQFDAQIEYCTEICSILAVDFVGLNIINNRQYS
jgi:pimeloyl-ACP methyl ester carboxylesterase